MNSTPLTPSGIKRRVRTSPLVVRLVSSLSIFLLLHGALGQPSTKPAPAAAEPSTVAATARFEKMAARFEALIESYRMAKTAVDHSQWTIIGRAAPGAVRMLPRENLKEDLTKQRAMLDAIDENIRFHTDPEVDANLDRLFRRAAAGGRVEGWKRADVSLHSWRLRRKAFGAVYEVHKIVDKNWEEFRLVESPPPEAQLQPWQREINRLLSEMRPAQKELEEMQKPDPAEEQARLVAERKEGRNAARDLVETGALRLKAPTGFEGAKWLMSRDEVKAVRPKARDDGDDLFEPMEWLDRPVAVTYDFEKDMLVAVHVIFSKRAVKGEFEKTQDYLQTAHGKMSVPEKTEDYLLQSSYLQERFSISHVLRHDNSESVTFFRTK